MSSHKLSVGIVGLPNVGKSTLFNLMTRQQVPAANYPFCTISPNVGIVPVPDQRLERVAAVIPSARALPAVIEFYDIAGLVKGAHRGAGLGNQFLAHLRDVQAMVIVVRCFPDSNIIHVEQTVNPGRDIDTVNNELALKDLEVVEKQLEKAERELAILQRIRELLQEGRLLGEKAEEAAVKDLRLLTAKKQLYLLNGEPGDVKKGILEKISALGGAAVVLDLATATAAPEVITAAYQQLGLITFFTGNEKETRAWSVPAGTTAREAARVVHSDFEKKFIVAETINWEKLVTADSWLEAKKKGWLRSEGRDYLVQDGDVILIRH